MATSEEPNKADASVTISLKAVDPSPEFLVSERRIILTKNNPSISIGRASKQESKGLVAAVGNAWFDSPVMSREHARLTVNFDNAEVSLEDTGSLHGTYRRNGEITLQPFVKQVIQEGDIYCFGADVYRGRQAYPPCVVQTALTWQEHANPASKAQRATPSNTFSVPEYDDEDLWSDVEDVNSGTVNQVEKGKQPATIIDLCNNSPVVQSQPYDPASSPTVHQLRSDVIDLTSDPDTPSGSSQMAIPSSLPTVITDASDDNVDAKDQDMTCDSDIESEAPSDSEEEDVDAGDLDESSDDDMASVMDPMSPVDDESNMDSDIDSTSIASNEYEYDEEQDDETDTYGFLSDAPYISRYEDEDSICSSSQDDGDSTDESAFQDDKVSSPDQTCSTSPDVLKPMFSDPSQLLHCLPPSAFIPSGYAPQPPCPLNQQPSQPALPLDAVSTSVFSSHMLGDRTGKYDFFAAREENRATVMNRTRFPAVPSTNIVHETEVPRTSTTGGFTNHREELEDSSAAPTCASEKESESTTRTLPDIRLEATHDTNQPPLISSVWTPAGEAFLKDANEYPLPDSPTRTRLQSPELDMTSAAKFVESKNKNTATGDDTRLTVKFLLTQESPSSSQSMNDETNYISRPTKRSWDVFDEGNEDLSQASFAADFKPASSLSSPDLEEHGVDEVKKNDSTSEILEADHHPVDVGNIASEVVFAAAQDSDRPQVIFTGASQDSTARPAKRQRFSKLAKYASVSVASGFTGAALLFAGLAATAPQII